MKKEIENIVFYKFNGELGEMEQACIFYKDGTVKSVSTDEAVDAAYDLAFAEKITKNQFQSMLNNKKIYTLTGDEFERRFHEFLGTGAVAVKKTPTTPQPQKTKEEATGTEPVAAIDDSEENIIPPVIVPVEEEEDEEENVASPAVPVTVPSTETIPTPNNKKSKRKNKKKKNKKTKKNKTKKKGFFKSVKTRVIAGIMAGVMLVAGMFGLSKLFKNKTDDNQRTGTSISMEGIESQDQPYINMLNKTKNATQKAVMKKQGEDLDAYNRDFSEKYIEEGKTIKPALTWDEIMALNLAYNTYTKDQIRTIFNGSEVNSTEMTNAYKNATLQLMGAYVIETRANPVDTTMFLKDEKHQEFAKKYNELFLKCKETTGDEQVKAINAFYEELYKDFPISDKVREEGISHAEDRKLLETYKLSIVPIVAASEIMFQNKGDIDHTLSDKAIAYFNDLGLCNLAEEQFEKAETITLAAQTDENLPLYQDFKTAKIIELKTEGNYNISDASRDLSQLDAFQKQVNGTKLEETSKNTSADKKQSSTTTKKTTKTTTKTETKKTTTSSRKEAVSVVGEEAVKKAENEVDAQINTENDKAKAEAEAKAEQKRQELQAAADAEAEKLKQDIANADKQFQQIIGNINDIISNGGTVGESDFGDYNVDFDSEYTDGSGQLDGSVTDITTDGTGAVGSYEPLPDPNKTGTSFENESNNISTDTGYNDYTEEQLPSPEETDNAYGSTNDSYTNDSYTSNSSDIYQYEESYNNLEAEIDAYIESLDGQGAEEVVAYQYTK